MKLVLSKERMKEAYATMWRIRKFDEKAVELFGTGVIKGGTTHPYVGEEAVATGVCMNLNQDDYISSCHRGHGHCIAKGGKVKEMMAELFGKVTGSCKGKGGSLHIADFDIGILGANGIVGAGMPLATGAAFAAQYKGTGQVAVSFFGDGASQEGVFHEALNLASIWNLPIIFVCENNGFAVSAPVHKMIKVDHIAQRAAAYAMEGFTVDGNDFLEVYRAADRAVAKARGGGGPTLLECVTYRWLGHSRSDTHQPYRTQEEVAQWRKRCPIKRLGEYMMEQGYATAAELEEIEAGVVREIEEAMQFAQESPEPAPETLYDNLYAD